MAAYNHLTDDALVILLKQGDEQAFAQIYKRYAEKLAGFAGLGGPIGFNDDGDAIKAFYVVQGQNGAWQSKVRGCSAPDGKQGC